MPPKGRRGSLATIALRKTPPHWSSATRRCCSTGSRVQAEAARPKGVSLAISMASLTSLDTEEHGDGTEELFAIDGGGARDAGEDGGLEVVAFAEHALAAGEDAGAGVGGGFDLGFELFDDADRGERADVGVFFHGVTDAHGLHAGDEARFEGVVDLVCDDEAFGGDAGLAGVDAAGTDGGFDGEIEVGGGHDDEGVAAA